MDEAQRIRVRDDLQGLFKGELLFDDLSRALYSTDASIFQIQPLGVAVPRDEEDVSVLVRYAAENRFSLIARGAGAGVAGGCLGPGLVVDFSTHLRDILEIDERSVRVQPGVTVQAVQQRLEALGKRLGPGLSLDAVHTLGGLISTHASGAGNRTFVQNNVEELRVVLDNGAVACAQRQPLQPLLDQGGPSHFGDMVQALQVLWEQNQELIKDQSGSANRMLGYRLDALGRAGQLDLPRLLVGSEGTLALFTSIGLRIESMPGGRSLVLAAFERLDAALEAGPDIAASGPTACVLLDRRLLSLVKGNADLSEAAALIPARAEALVFVEYETVAPAQAELVAQRLAQSLAPALTFAAWQPDALERLERLRGGIVPSLAGQRGAAQPLPFVEDVAVPGEAVRECVRRLQDIFHEHEVTAPLLVDLITGQVQTRPILNLREAEDCSRLPILSEKIHELALSLGGTISAQGGLGLARSSWVARHAGALYPLLRQIKAIFDPHGLFNPGKIVDPDPALASWPLRTLATNHSTRILSWPRDGADQEANHCNGCGQCRTTSAPQRMCPIFRATRTEAATPRAKANLLRDLLQSSEPAALSSDQVRAVADLCVNCKMCAVECPAHVNIPKLMLEAKAANVAAHGLDRSEWFLARLEGFARWGSRFRRLVNLMLRIRPGRWLLQKLFGLAPRRRLPLLARRTFLSIARERGWTKPPVAGERPRVILFVDLFANYFDPQIAEAAVLVLRHNGFDVFVPPNQVSSGIQALAHGDVDAARDLARRNLQALADLAREGLPIICLEPSAALMLRQDYLDLLDDLDARLVAAQTVEFTAFLRGLHQHGDLRTDLRPLPFGVAHHVPCHLKALGPRVNGSLLGLIPDLHVQTLDVSCSGMAGTFGLKVENYTLSLEAGKPMLDELRRAEARYGVTECSSCRLQMEDGARKRTLHPAQYLALAYGLLPEVEQRLAEPIGELVLR